MLRLLRSQPFLLKLALCLSLVGFLSAGSALAQAQQSPQHAVQAAIAAYDRGDFAQAATIYENLIATGLQNGHIYYNLGNTYFRLHDNGKAMAAYLAARRLLPRDPDLKANLAYLNAQNRDRLAYVSQGDLQFLCFWCDRTTLKELFFTATALLVLGFLALALSRLHKPRGSWQHGGVSCLALAGLVFFACFISYSRDSHWGAITAAKASVRSGPGEHNTLVFELHAGAPFKWEDAKDGWLRIRLADGKSGWVPQKSSKVYNL